MTVYVGNKFEGTYGAAWTVGAANAIPAKKNATGAVSTLGTYTFAASNTNTLTSGDQIYLNTLPAGCALTGVTLDCDKLDQGGTPALVLEVGYTGNPGAFISGSVVGKAGGFQYQTANGALGYTPTVDTPIFAQATTTANGTITAGTAASIRLQLEYTSDP